MPAIRPKSTNYTHEAVIDWILAEPGVTQREIAAEFGYTEAWMSIIIGSDAFKEKLAERKAQLTDPRIIASINERLDAVAKRSLDRIMDRLDSPVHGSIKTADLVSIARLGVGDKNTRPAGPTIQTNLYVVALPTPAKTAETWLSNRSHPTPGLEILQEVPRG